MGKDSQPIVRLDVRELTELPVRELGIEEEFIDRYFGRRRMPHMLFASGLPVIFERN